MSVKNTGAQTSKSSDAARLRAEAAEQKALREVTRYRVDGEPLPEGAEPAWDDLTPWSTVEKYTYGAGWQSVLPIRPVMAEEMRDRTRPPTDSRIPLEGPIWPPS